MRAFFRSILAADPGVDADTADRLSERLTKRVARMLVWDASGADEPAATGATAAAPAPQDRPDDEASPAQAPTSAAAPTSREAPEPFDPFAFSIVVVLKRQGRAALMKRLDAITDAAHLHQMAVAQHIGIDKSITAPAKLREAIVAGAEQRLADRRAAAS